MTPADLRAICDSLNDERGTGGQTKLARLLGWNYSTLWRKLNGKSRITQSDELEITGAVGSYHALLRNNTAAVTPCTAET
jgi:Bacterial regulatory protein, Fis family